MDIMQVGAQASLRLLHALCLLTMLRLSQLTRGPCACVCLQDAEKGVKFKSLPPILQLQLKRFEYDFDRNMTVKVTIR